MPDYTTTVSRIAHYLLIFALAGILAFEIGVIRLDMKCEDLVRVARVDLWYGVLAGAIVVVGFSRAVFSAKGCAYYSVNMFFWAKMAAFAAESRKKIFRRRQNREQTFICGRSALPVGTHHAGGSRSRRRSHFKVSPRSPCA